jgi:hypothetical protein
VEVVRRSLPHRPQFTFSFCTNRSIVPLRA